MHQVEALHILDGEAVQRIEHVAADAALVGAQEDAVAVFGVHRHAGRAVLADDLFALHQLHALLLQGGNDVFGLFVRAEDAHVGAALGPQLFGEHGKVHRVAAGVHGFDVLVFVHDIVAKAQDLHLICHRSFAPFLKNQYFSMPM